MCKWKWMKRIGLGLVGLMAVILLSGAAYQLISTTIEERAHFPAGKLVDIGGYRLHIHGLGQGGPTVILEAGMGCNSLDWTLVQPEIAKFARVYSYDRAGYGWSDESPLERTSQNIVEELHKLLENVDEKGPYILVGHSFGGSNVLLYASQYPDDVAGVVLVDSAQEDLLQELPDIFDKNLLEKTLFRPTLAPFWASIGVFRLFYHFSPILKKCCKIFPSDIQQEYFALQNTIKCARSLSQEVANFDKSLKQLKAAGGYLGDKPLIVISAGKMLTSEESGYSKEFTDKYVKVWETLQKNLAAKSTRGKLIVAEHSGHGITYEQPEIIVQAVHEIIANHTIQ